jgi:hypothetical protein
MSRFDDELRAAASRLANEPLPENILDPALDAPTGRRTLWFAGAAVGAILLVGAVGWVSGRIGLPMAAEATPTADPSGFPVAGGCDDVPPIDAQSSEYRVYFPCADGGIASGPRVTAIAPEDELLADALNALLAGPTDEERDAGMVAVAEDASGDLVADVVIQPDGLAIVDFDAGLADAGLTPAFLDAVRPTALQFAQVTAVELRLDGDCERLFALFSAVCDHLAEPVALEGDCPILPPEALPTGSGMTAPRPHPDDPRTVSWGGGGETVTQRIGERGGEPFLTDGLEIEIRGQAGFVAEDRPELGWVEDGCPYLVTMPGQEPAAAYDYGLALFGTDPSPSSPPLVAAPFETATLEEDGLRLTLSLDRASTAFEERVWAEVVLENIGDDVVHWGHSGTCTWPAGVTGTTDEPAPPAGPDWPGDAGVLKRVAVDSPDVLQFAFAPEESLDVEGAFGCTSDLVWDEIQPEQRLTNRFFWDTVGPNGMPPPGGRFVAEATFGYAGRGDLPQNSDPFARSLTVAVSLDVEPPDTDYLSPGEAMDALLADTTFVRLLAEAPRERWTEARLQWAGDAWDFALHLDSPNERLVATVDVVTGAVSGVAVVER